jgi:hypothetical protein
MGLIPLRSPVGVRAGARTTGVGGFGIYGNMKILAAWRGLLGWGIACTAQGMSVLCVCTRIYRFVLRSSKPSSFSRECLRQCVRLFLDYGARYHHASYIFTRTAA